jgi:hypothetical protein
MPTADQPPETSTISQPDGTLVVENVDDNLDDDTANGFDLIAAIRTIYGDGSIVDAVFEAGAWPDTGDVAVNANYTSGGFLRADDIIARPTTPNWKPSSRTSEAPRNWGTAPWRRAICHRRLTLLLIQLHPASMPVPMRRSTKMHTIS